MQRKPFYQTSIFFRITAALRVGVTDGYKEQGIRRGNTRLPDAEAQVFAEKIITRFGKPSSTF